MALLRKLQQNFTDQWYIPQIMIPQAAKNRNLLLVLIYTVYIKKNVKTPFNLQIPSLVSRTSAYLL